MEPGKENYEKTGKNVENHPRRKRKAISKIF
jgi:hypothetical protein